MKNLLLSFTFLLLCSHLPAQTTINYTPSSDDSANPERGFYRYTDSQSSNHSPLSLSYLNQIRTTENITVIFRYYYLDNFQSGPISTSHLAAIAADFDIMRQAGVKVVLRFAYSSTYTPNPPHNDGPTKPIVMTHIEQLKPIIRQNSDVLLTLQSGFIGTWGEHYYSDAFGCPCTGPLTAQNWADRKEVSDSLLAILPANRMLSIRAPEYKGVMYNFNIPNDSLTYSEAHNGSIKSRIGYHNDCFLAASNDWTFSNTNTEKPYWEAESRYTIMGGETCNDNPTYTNCANAMTDLENAHWTYLNDDYHPAVLSRWENEGCMDEIRLRLGYRLQLTTGSYSPQAYAGDYFSYELSLENVGFAAPVNPRTVELVFKNGIETFTFPLDIDPREWFADGMYTLSGNLPLPLEMAGDYDLFLHLPDAESSLSNDPNYAIRLANTGTWDATTGYNNLQMTVNITPPLLIQTKIHLEGPHQAATPTLMTDNLRTNGYLPLEEPYNLMGFPTLNNWTGNNINDPIVLTVNGADAIVDWVFLELRDSNSPTTTLASKAALLKSDGTIVNTDGSFPVKMAGLPDGNYYLAVRHRTHLALMSGTPLTFYTSNSTLVDFTSAATPIYGNSSRKDIGGILSMWAGDTNGDTFIDAADRSETWNNRNSSGYLNSDVNLSGQCDATDRSITWNNRNK